jgi:hypothetical protein
MRELGVHTNIIAFLVENFKQIESNLKENNSKDIDKVFRMAFRFLVLFIEG